MSDSRRNGRQALALSDHGLNGSLQRNSERIVERIGCNPPMDDPPSVTLNKYSFSNKSRVRCGAAIRKNSTNGRSFNFDSKAEATEVSLNRKSSEIFILPSLTSSSSLVTCWR